jgi:trehalose 6-phosphate synthase
VYDVVGFQTDKDTDNFARYLANECHIPMIDSHTFHSSGHLARVGTFPISIPTAEFNRLARRATRSPFVKNVQASLTGHIMMIGVDALDYTKGLPLRMEAFEHFLNAQIDWRGLVVYLQITPKNHTDIAECADIERTLGATAGRINATYGDASWTPIRYVNRTYSGSDLASGPLPGGAFLQPPRQIEKGTRFCQEDGGCLGRRGSCLSFFAHH